MGCGEMGIKGIINSPVLNKNLKLLIASNCVVTFVSTALQSVLLGIYIQSIGFDEVFLGNLIAARTLAAGVAAILAGMMANTLGRRNTMILGIVLGAIGYLGQVLTTEGSLIMFFAVVSGGGLTLTTVNEAPSMAEFAEDNYKVNAFSYNFIIVMIASVIGSSLAGRVPSLLRMENSIRVTMLLFSGISLVSIFPLWKLPNHKGNREKPENNSYYTLLKNKFVLGVLIYNTFIGFGAGLVVPFFNVFLQYKLSANTSQIGLIMSFAQTATVVGAMMVPMVSRKIGKVKTVNLCQLLSIPFLLSISFSNTILITTVGFFFRNALMNMTTPITSSLAMDLVEDAERSSLSGLITVSANITRGISAMVAGWTMYHISYEFPYYMTAVLYLLATIAFNQVYTKFYRRKETERLL